MARGAATKKGAKRAERRAPASKRKVTNTESLDTSRLPQATRSAPEEIIEQCVRTYIRDQRSIKLALDQMTLYLNSSEELAPHLHTLKARLKDAEHLRDKLHRKLAKKRAAGEIFDIDSGNLFEKINDLAGIRLLHLHRGQVGAIHAAITKIAEDNDLRIIEVFARTWDDNSRQVFAEIGIPIEISPNLYTSVHYVIGWGRKLRTCEIQVRTLLEEVWGEIDHAINYPHPTDDVACREQLRTLAVSVMAATTNVEGIIRTVAELKRRSLKVEPAAK